MCEVDASDHYYSYYTKDGKRVRKGGGESLEAPSMPTVRGAAVGAQAPAPAAPHRTGHAQSGSRFSRG